MTELEQEDLSTVSEEELFVERGSDGELLPVWQTAPILEKEIRIIPMTYGKIKQYFGADTQMEDISDEDVAEILRNHVVEPDLSEITSDEVANHMKPMVPQVLLLAIMEGSGVEVDLENLQNEEPLLEGN